MTVSDEPRVILVGEDNPHGADPRYALHHEPRGASGDRLRRILGLSVRDYFAIPKRNLCDGPWKMADARRRAAETLAEGWDVVVMCGAKVRMAFGVPRMEPFSAQGVLVALPHPSGRNLVWNDPRAAERGE